MWNPFHPAQPCRDWAQQCRASAALCAPSTEIRRYSQLADHSSPLAAAEERAHAGLRALASSKVLI